MQLETKIESNYKYHMGFCISEKKLYAVFLLPEKKYPVENLSIKAVWVIYA